MPVEIMTQPKRRNEKGNAILMALFLTMMATFLVTPVLNRAVYHHASAFRENRYITSVHLAEGGIEEAIWHLSYDDEEEWSAWVVADPEKYTKTRTLVNDMAGYRIGEYEVEITNPIPLSATINLGAGVNLLPFPITSSSRPTIVATAGVPDIASLGSEVRRVQVRARARTIFSLGLFSDLDLELGGTTVVNSYDSRNGPYGSNGNVGSNGDAGSNDNILINGTPIIDGDAAAGGSVITVGDGSEVTGQVEGGLTEIDLPPVDEFVDAAKLGNNNLEIPPAVKSNGQPVNAYDPITHALNVAAGATLSLPGGTAENPKVYYFSGGKLNGNSKILIDGHAIIFTDGTLDFTGGTILNNGGSGTPAQFAIYSSGDLSTEIKLNGGAGYAGIVYAPEAHIRISGGGDFYGAAVGKKVDISGNGEFHYDEALGDVGLIAFFQVDEWVEKSAPNLGGTQS